jgi:large subunit ribosomal protein L18
MDSRKSLNEKRARRKTRTRARISGTASRPRLSIFRSNRYVAVQLIDDESGKTLLSASTRPLAKDKKEKGETKVKQAEKMGEMIAQKAVEKGIKEAVFDRGGYKYHGRVKTVAESARKAGLKL